MKLFKSVCILFILINSIVFSQIRINEVCASNSGSLYDENSKTPDWIELYNYSTEPISLNNWRISNSKDYENAWQFPDTIIQPSSYLIVFADGKDKTSSNLKIRTNGINTNTEYFNDNLSMLYLTLNGDNEFKVKFNSYYFNIDTSNIYSLAGIILKDKLTPNSRMVSLFIKHEDVKSILTMSRLKNDEYRDVDVLKIRSDLDKLSFAIKKVGDTVHTIIYDKFDFPVLQKSYYLPNANNYYIGLTGITTNLNNFNIVNIESVLLNNSNISINEFSNKSFYKTKLNFAQENLLHSNFKLSKDQDSVFLFKEGEIIDSLIYSDLDIDESLSFKNNGFAYTINTTPGKQNTEGFDSKSILELNEHVKIFSDSITIDSLGNSVYFNKETNRKEIDKLLDKNYFTDSELLTLQRNEKGLQPSTIKYLRLINEKDIVNNSIHVFLNTDSFELFNDVYGVLAAFESDKRLTTYCTIFKGTDLLFNDNIEISKHGNLSSIGRIQSSMRLYFDDNIGEIFGDKLFPNKTKKYGTKINLRNAGNDTQLYIRDLFAQNMASKLNVEWSDFTPSFVYINNDFWGLYNIRQRIDNDFLAGKYKLESDDINIFQDNIRLKYGTNSELITFYNSINELSPKQVYQYADSIFNLDSFIDYLFVETFVVNHDWLYNNVEAWNTKENKWKFILNDLDYAFKLHGAGSSTNSLDYIFNSDTLFILRILNNIIQEDSFRNKFFNRVCDLINTEFSKEVLNSKLDIVKEQYEDLVYFQNQKWPETVKNWEEDLIVISKFINRRQDYYLEHCNQYLNFPGLSNINLSTYPPNIGTFKVNTVNVDTSEWSGRYFQTLPVTITAIPNHGMKFLKWNHDSLGTDATITTTLPELIDLEAIYEKVEPTNQATYIVINEIMYNADKLADTKDWVELYNAGKESVNLNGWSLIDEDLTHELFVIDEDYFIKPDEYVILTKEKIEFEKHITIANKIFGDFTFGLGGKDIVLLKDANGKVQDSVSYTNKAPWPDNADGTGMTIELINPILDNNIGTNWLASKSTLGTPGKQNSNYNGSITSVEVIDNKINCKIDFINSILSVSSKELIQRINLFDITGRKISEFAVDNIRAEYNLSDYNSGLYLGTVLTSRGSQTFKLIIRK